MKSSSYPIFLLGSTNPLRLAIKLGALTVLWMILSMVLGSAKAHAACSLTLSPDPGNIPASVRQDQVCADTNNETPTYTPWLAQDSDASKTTIDITNATQPSIALGWRNIGTIGWSHNSPCCGVPKQSGWTDDNHARVEGFSATGPTGVSVSGVSAGDRLDLNGFNDSPGFTAQGALFFSLNSPGGFHNGTYTVTFSAKLINHFSNGTYICVGGTEASTSADDFNPCVAQNVTMTINVSVDTAGQISGRVYDSTDSNHVFGGQSVWDCHHQTATGGDGYFYFTEPNATAFCIRLTDAGGFKDTPPAGYNNLRENPSGQSYPCSIANPDTYEQQWSGNFSSGGCDRPGTDSGYDFTYDPIPPPGRPTASISGSASLTLGSGAQSYSANANANSPDGLAGIAAYVSPTSSENWTYIGSGTPASGKGCGSAATCADTASYDFPAAGDYWVVVNAWNNPDPGGPGCSGNIVGVSSPHTLFNNPWSNTNWTDCSPGTGDSRILVHVIAPPTDSAPTISGSANCSAGTFTITVNDSDPGTPTINYTIDGVAQTAQATRSYVVNMASYKDTNGHTVAFSTTGVKSDGSPGATTVSGSGTFGACEHPPTGSVGFPCGGAAIMGWAEDPDNGAALQVKVFVDGNPMPGSPTTANGTVPSNPSYPHSGHLWAIDDTAYDDTNNHTFTAIAVGVNDSGSPDGIDVTLPGSGFRPACQHLPTGSITSHDCDSLSGTAVDSDYDYGDPLTVILVVDGTLMDGSGGNPSIQRLTNGTTHAFDFTNALSPWKDFTSHNFQVKIIGVDPAGVKDGRDAFTNTVAAGPCAHATCGNIQAIDPGTGNVFSPSPQPGESFKIRFSFTYSGGSKGVTPNSATNPMTITGFYSNPSAPYTYTNPTTVWDSPVQPGQPAGIYTETMYVSGVGMAPNPCPPVDIVVANHPYLKSFGNDVQVGSGFTSGASCTQSTAANAQIHAYINGDLATYGGGSSVEYAAMAIGVIGGGAPSDGFASASQRGSPPKAPIGLTLANSGVAGYGGNLGTDSARCMPDYFGTTQDTGISVNNSVPNGTAVNLASVADPGQSLYNMLPGATLYMPQSAGNFTKHHTVFVNGDVFIKGDITYGPGWATTDQIPAFTLIVKGNIYISSTVSTLDGLYIAQPSSGAKGEIYTCRKSTDGSQIPDATLFADCDNQLTVHGAFIAKTVKLLRTHGTINQATPADGRTGSQAAEVFDFSPEIYMSHPVLKPSSAASYNWNSVSGLAPVF